MREVWEKQGEVGGFERSMRKTGRSKRIWEKLESWGLRKTGRSIRGFERSLRKTGRSLEKLREVRKNLMDE